MREEPTRPSEHPAARSLRRDARERSGDASIVPIAAREVSPLPRKDSAARQRSRAIPIGDEPLISKSRVATAGRARLGRPQRVDYNQPNRVWLATGRLCGTVSVHEAPANDLMGDAGLEPATSALSRLIGVVKE
jgi:hypothetical protein